VNGAQPSPRRASAFAPASVGNVGVGFDILGFAVDALGDRATVTRSATPGVVIRDVRGVASELPREPERNTAGRALLRLRELAGIEWGFELELEKGIPLGSGLGGSAASAVVAAVAGNALLTRPLSEGELLECALAGEEVASGSRHADNVAPALLGGLVLCVGEERPLMRRIPVPRGVRAVIAHPRMFLATREARAILAPSVSLHDLVRQTANLAGVLAGCFTSDLELIQASLTDVVIEPQRARLIPGCGEALAAARAAGALGGSISGAGPTLFAWARAEDAERVGAALNAGLARHGHAVDAWIVRLDSSGARVLAVG
jgi:homoserine kinase